MTMVRITEYLDIDCETEMWHCNRCGFALYSARDNYKKGCLVRARVMEEVHPAIVPDAALSFRPDEDYCRLIEFYCPGCGIQIENEYLPPGHPITHDIELDIDALKMRHAPPECAKT